MSNSVALRELAPTFDKTINSVCNSFYSPALAAKVNRPGFAGGSHS
ncbi:hypothetical protein DF3PA_70162 [Candidatus Defluviicoccus seviourii]|uniref:Uncharacterized protein n=2 Tax=root TaxID=1 RepID=A0A564WHP4_9PROT|nr:hypothetical protein DF3PB_1430001 [uncultured Defluviicoccus sp.]VUX47841.1 hypothetical protein DF3PA_70162 [Candidatus Defluviicoccus seviourii]